MAELIKKTRAILTGNRGESLLEGLASVLIFTLMMAAIGLMIMVSMKVTEISTASGGLSQAEANAALSGIITDPGIAVDVDDIDIRFIIGDLMIDIDANIIIYDDDTTDIIEVAAASREAGGFVAFGPR